MDKHAAATTTEALLGAAQAIMVAAGDGIRRDSGLAAAIELWLGAFDVWASTPTAIANRRMIDKET